MKILTSEQIRSADRSTIINEPISSIDLMERAAEKCCEFFPPKGKWSYLVVVCGVGNNGGDGLAIARLMLENFKAVRVLVLESSKNYSNDFKINLKRLEEQSVNIQFITRSTDIFLQPGELVVDAILGIGVNRAVDDFLGECIDVINEQAEYVISIDLPSGMIADGPTTGKIIRANETLTIGAPKLALFMPETAIYAGDWKLIDIYKQNNLQEEFDNTYEAIGLTDARLFLKARSKFSHKGTFGKALLVAGGEGKYGSAILAARGCMRSGVGLLSVHVPLDGVDQIHVSIPEALLKPDEDRKMITKIEDVEIYDSIGIGPGIGTSNETIDALISLIKGYEKPLVLDADALNILAEHPDLISDLAENSILTPHPKEFERLFGPCHNSFERLDKQITHSVNHKVIIVCKGHHTIITSPDGKVFVNLSGNSGLAKGGSGDVLMGVITSLLAQGYSPIHSALLGVFVHGHSADLLSETMHEAGILPTDVIENLPFAFKNIST